jgi:hypothetical protein
MSAGVGRGIARNDATEALTSRGREGQKTSVE